MKSIRLKTATLLLGAGLFLVGCDEGDDTSGSMGGKAYPPVGSYVHVQFRRDYLGLSSDKAMQPLEGGLASSGELKKITDDFVVLQVDNEPNRELWIPRGAVLLMDVHRKPAGK